jgi:hypothetical protein
MIWYLLQINILKRVTRFSLLQGEPIPFVPFSHRFHTPYEAAGSTSPFWYSFKRGPAHVIVMAAYSAFGKYLLLLFLRRMNLTPAFRNIFKFQASPYMREILSNFFFFKLLIFFWMNQCISKPNSTEKSLH